MRVLSTYAINTLYLLSKLYPDDFAPIDAKAILALGKTYDMSDKKSIQMLMYLYTHCIIGETLFYWSPLANGLDEYTSMLVEIDGIIDELYEDINLDNKLEFLVCCRLANYDPRNRDRIYAEAEQSLDGGGYIVDTHNNNINPLKQSFMMSEHRNVLYVMSQSNPEYNNTPVA
jgi:hypothetical protein